ncbi:MAG TPA: hypothetical protein VF511_07580, partial [Chthoniobacterales bacterium]
MQTPNSYSQSLGPRSALAVCLLLHLTSGNTFAVDRNYDAGADVFGTPGSNPTAWGAFENWSPDGVPTSDDTVTFDNNFYQTLPNVHLGGVNRVANSLYLVFQPTQGQWRLGANEAGGTGSSATLTLTSGVISFSDTNNNSVQIIGATSGAGLLPAATMTLATEASGFTIYHVDAEAELQIEAVISGAGKTLTKNGAGLLSITRASAFTGATTLGADFDGRNTLNAAVNGALGGTSSISVDSGASLILSGAAAFDRIRNEAPITLGGPDYTGIPSLPPAIRRAGGGNEGLGNQVGLGLLTVTALNAILHYGGDAVANGTLTFADLAVPGDSTLSIRGHHGAFGTATAGIDGTDDRLIFATDQTSNLPRL